MLLERENNRNQEVETPQSPTQSSTASSFMSNSTIPTSVASYNTTAKVLTGPGGKPRRPLSQRYPTQPPYDRWRRAVDADTQSVGTASASASASADDDDDAFADADDDGDVQAATRPTPERFDSLQELLEQAGYKDTRVITPQAKVLAARVASRGRSVTPISHTPSAPHAPLEDNDRTPTKSNFSAVSAPPETTPAGSSSNSGWFGSLWRGISSTSRSRSPSPTPAAPRAAVQDTPASPRNALRSVSATSPTKVRKASATLRNARSAAHLPLWKGSRSHVTSASKHAATTSAAATSPPTLQNKASPGQLRSQTASIGVGISAADGGSAFGNLKKTVSQRTSQEGLKHAFFAAEAGSPTSATYSASIDEWRRNLVNVKGPQRPAVEIEEANADDVSSPPRFRLKNTGKAAQSEATVAAADLFGSLATPIVTADPAVAPRNAECFAGPDARGLRHAKSVEALRGALKNGKKLALKERHSIIGQFAWGSSPEEVPPVPALPSMPSDPSIRSMGVGKTVYQDNAAQMTSPERPNGPPVLTLTSPSGVHSPQFIRLDSREFSLTLSPEQQRRILARCASRASGSSRSVVEEEESEHMLITEESLPSQLRNIGGEDEEESASHDAEAQRRRFAMGPRRFDSQDAFSDGESSAGSSCGSDQPSQDGDDVPRRRKTRRGCRGGRSQNKKKTSTESLDAAAAQGEAVTAAPKQPLRRKTSSRSNGRRGQTRPATADAALQHTTTNTMPSFGSALQGLPRSASPAPMEEDDPFIAHVTQAEELKKNRSMSASALLDNRRSTYDDKVTSRASHQGIASILFEGKEEKENDENAPPQQDMTRSSTPPKLRSRGSNSALKGRIVGRARPLSSASSTSEQEVSVSSKRVPVTMGAVPVHGTDSPTRPVAARRLRSSRSRNAL